MERTVSNRETAVIASRRIDAAFDQLILTPRVIADFLDEQWVSKACKIPELVVFMSDRDFIATIFQISDNPQRFENYKHDHRVVKTLSLLANPPQDETLNIVAQMCAEVKKESQQTRAAMNALQTTLLNGQIEAVDVTIPTSFVILPFKMHETNNCQDKISKATKFFQLIGDILTGSTEAFNSFEQDQLYFYLIDEGTGQVVDIADGVYPIEINPRSLLSETYMPLVMQSFRLLKAFNSVTSIFGREIPENIMEAAQKYLNTKNDDIGSTIVPAGLEHRMVVHSVRGTAELSELKDFYAKHDSKSTFGGLKRRSDNKGNVIFTRSSLT
jgi:hypothetical protein